MRGLIILLGIGASFIMLGAALKINNQLIQKSGHVIVCDEETHYGNIEQISKGKLKLVSGLELDLDECTVIRRG